MKIATPLILRTLSITMLSAASVGILVTSVAYAGFGSNSAPAGPQMDEIRRDLCGEDQPDFNQVNTAQEKEATSRLLFRYRQLWNLYSVRNDTDIHSDRKKETAIAKLMNVSREPCLTSDQPASYVRLKLLTNANYLKRLLEQEITVSSTSGQRVAAEANLNYLNSVILKGLQTETPIYPMSKKNFKAEFKNMMPNTESATDPAPTDGTVIYSRPGIQISQ